ncbi:hypothetical protein AMAG_10967 [Allomyces macrogynus ATCC 38327]|uniref:NADP-dependent oxidoreductase domain-containing protein n=1 Tax=Allomyces macrogynus (strain ATCC 38327) TaxID=578462 RepID=A0A0L0SSH3_ALLM3|nr:hypothetical protein AMAG_10967 [Allomyces macrogynus ATCC 38327]|eukprot:KNE65325.1 hypothetical protein AMAG_10967 [Allomyces macrogynus ATCC 38327]
MTTKLATVTLRNGSLVPGIAFGTGTKWFKRPAKDADQDAVSRELVDSIKRALHAGIRHLDTAEMYNTEEDVGLAIREFLAESGLKRSDLYITSKLFKGATDVRGTLTRALALLQLDYLDQYLLHAPFLEDIPDNTKTLGEIWAEIEAVHRDGLVRDIGVSNFGIPHFEALRQHATIFPLVNQIEFHPLLQQTDLAAYAKEHGVVLSSYGPLTPLTGSPDKVDATALNVALDAAAERAGKTRAQVLLRWNLQKGRVVVSTTANPDRLAPLVEVQSFELTEDEVKEIDAAGATLTYRKFWATKKFD